MIEAFQAEIFTKESLSLFFVSLLSSHFNFTNPHNGSQLIV